MSRTSRKTGMRQAVLALAVLAGMWAAAQMVAPAGVRAQSTNPTAAPPTATTVPVGGRIQAQKACYVRLPDLPKALFGMFGAVNPDTGVLVAAGGGERIDENNIVAYYQLRALSLSDPNGAWTEVPYASTVGYTREIDKGCREMASASIDGHSWVSVFGKDGCDRGRFDTAAKKGGDAQVLRIGATADMAGVSWLPHSGVDKLVDQLVSRNGTLVALFATWDTTRNRLIFGQGSFNTKRETEARYEVYSANPLGAVLKLSRLDPAGTAPERRYGSCGAYVHDAATGVDGVIVLGGKEGTPYNVPSRNFKEVWWLDFSKSSDGEWFNITKRFANQDALGYRFDGACAYDTESHQFYTWMGVSDPKIPDGWSASGGAWRVNLSQLGDPTAALTFERLAQDNLPGIKGRRSLPSVWDPRQKRMFVIGGRNGIVENKDVWAIYPDVVGEACQTLDPHALPAGVPTVAPPPAPTEVPADQPKVCPQITSRVPAPVLASALANPSTIPGFKALKDPSKPAGPNNPMRTWLSLLDASKPHHPLFNALTWKAGCP